MLIAASPLSAGCRVWVELRVAEFDLAAAVQEEAEDDADGIGRDLGGDLVAGAVGGFGGGGGGVVRASPRGPWGRGPCPAWGGGHPVRPGGVGRRGAGCP